MDVRNGSRKAGEHTVQALLGTFRCGLGDRVDPFSCRIPVAILQTSRQLNPQLTCRLTENNIVGAAERIMQVVTTDPALLVRPQQYHSKHGGVLVSHYHSGFDVFAKRLLAHTHQAYERLCCQA